MYVRELKVSAERMYDVWLQIKVGSYCTKRMRFIYCLSRGKIKSGYYSSVRVSLPPKYYLSVWG